MTYLIGLLGFFTAQIVSAQVPAVYQNIRITKDGAVLKTKEGKSVSESELSTPYSLSQFLKATTGTKKGFDFDFGSNFNGTCYYGFTNAQETSKEQVIYFKRVMKISKGKASLNMASLSGKYDMIKWKENGVGTIGFRLANEKGKMIYDGRFSFEYKDSSFFRIPALIEGPFINQVQMHSAVIIFKTDLKCKAELRINDQVLKSKKDTTVHEFRISGLLADSRYSYLIKIGKLAVRNKFVTNPELGSRKPFVFAYASDSRGGQGGGERDLGGTNAYIMKRIMAANTAKGAKFMQFTGDLINGYLSDREASRLQYANWKRAVEPWWHETPIYVGMGNHEALGTAFTDEQSKTWSFVDKFPFETESAESLFKEEFCNFTNGPVSEDGSALDPDDSKIDFPSYSETCFSYSYDNIAMIVLNSNYWYAPSGYDHIGGNPHAYLMDNQMAWLKQQLKSFDEAETIDHIFVTQHTPAFPNGGHVSDDMWYHGDNTARPMAAGKKASEGIIERRDEYLNAIINESKKVRAILTGDEHNYNKLKLRPTTQIYPEVYEFPKISFSKSIYQINNGSAGAPYYAQEQTPWSSDVSNFSTQNVVVYLHVHGMKVRAEVINPVTFEKVDDFQVYPIE